MAIFHYKDQKMSRVQKTTFENESILEGRDLQTALKKNISVISDDLLIISEEFSKWSQGSCRIDLLAIDSQANIVVIELKRTDTGDYMELQAIRYAAMISTLTWQDTIGIFSHYLEKEYPSQTRNAEQELLEFLKWEEARADKFGQETHVVLVSVAFSSELTTSVLWLNDSGLNIKCVQIEPYKFNDEILINVRQIIPLPEVEDYQIRVRRKDEEERAARTERDYTQYLFKGELYNKRRLVLAVIKDWIEENSPKNFSELEKSFPKNSWMFKPEHDVTDPGRYFRSEELLIKCNDGSSYVVSNQWGIDRIGYFIKDTQNLGYKIEKAN